jgi:UDP-N-acetylmuramoyl-tripeptide--D-alanyl-D-alanine ligase
VVEMGARRKGEIRELCLLVNPRIGVLSAIGPAHLETFGSLEAVRLAKYELIEGLAADGVAVLNTDDLLVRSLADDSHRVEVVRYGIDPRGEPRISAEDIVSNPRGSELAVVDRQTGERLRVQSKLLGRHSVGHILAGVAVAVTVGRALSDLKAAIESLEPVAHRLQLIGNDHGITVIDDAYNSNPDGAAVAFEVLAAMPARRRVVVTPGIVELGHFQAEANRELGRRAARVADALLVVAGVNRAAIVAGARDTGSEVSIIEVDSLSEAQEALRSLLGPGDAVLFENDLPDHYEG